MCYGRRGPGRSEELLQRAERGPLTSVIRKEDEAEMEAQILGSWGKEIPGALMNGAHRGAKSCGHGG